MEIHHGHAPGDFIVKGCSLDSSSVSYLGACLGRWLKSHEEGILLTPSPCYLKYHSPSDDGSHHHCNELPSQTWLLPRKCTPFRNKIRGRCSESTTLAIVVYHEATRPWQANSEKLRLQRKWKRAQKWVQYSGTCDHACQPTGCCIQAENQNYNLYIMDPEMFS